MSKAYPLQWYILDDGSPHKLTVPTVGAQYGTCGADSVHSQVCTRPVGHGGRHAAQGSRRPNGTALVHEVWL